MQRGGKQMTSPLGWVLTCHSRRAHDEEIGFLWRSNNNDLYLQLAATSYRCAEKCILTVQSMFWVFLLSILILFDEEIGILGFFQSLLHINGRARVLGNRISMGDIVQVERRWCLLGPCGYPWLASGTFIGNCPDWNGYIADICQIIMLQPIHIKIATVMINLKSIWGHKGQVDLVRL